MDTMAEVGSRIRSRMPDGMSQRELAERAGMTPDALSRALNGLRGLSHLEIAKIAETLAADTYWLITGREDPHRVEVAARHDWDAKARRRVNRGRADDDSLLARIAVLYREAFPAGPPPSLALSRDPRAVRTGLGADFVRDFADRAEQRLGIDVVRVAGLTTDYSLRIGERGVIVLATMPRWFRSNWSLAHEIGHLALLHHDGNSRTATNEQPADRFAAELLLPKQLMTAQNWAGMSEEGLAEFVWRHGVSTEALRNRLSTLGISPNASVAAGLERSTNRLLRANVRIVRAMEGDGLGGDPVTLREQQSSTRRFPTGLVAALQQRVEDGAVDPRSLAWVWDVPIDEIDWPEPDESAAAERYEQVLHEYPGVDDWRSMLAADDASRR